MKYNSFFLVLILFIILSCASRKTITADLTIKNGTVYTGSDTIPKEVSIAIRGDKIIFIGNEKSIRLKTNKIIDAKGLLVCPGFIDPHTHADKDLIKKSTSDNLPFLMQGVTTVVVGNDGESYFPSKKYKEIFENNGLGTNVVLLAGHGTLRQEVIGNSKIKATPEQVNAMQELLQKELDSGVFGLSTGLFYSPGSYADTQEVIDLALVVAKNGGIYDTHLRDESSYSIGLIPSIQEAIEIGRQAKLPIHISHIKCLGVDVWNESDAIIKLIEKSRSEGIDITANQYPYDASATGLKAAVVSRWAESGGNDSLFIRYKNPLLKTKILKETKENIARRGGPEKLLIVKSEESSFEGKNLAEIASVLQLSPEETVFKILEKGYARVASFNMNEKDIVNFMKQAWVVTGSDGNEGHPRKYGSFPKKYNKYVKEDSIISVAKFINGSSSETASIFKIPNRGKIKEGYFADIIIFDPKTFLDKANYTDASQYAEGLKYSFINGTLVIENGTYSKLRPGKVLIK
ncbi:MAG: amidohydrolase [Bacteroidetes bacterium]|nr:amidohydrolase [Bacteroidota bacterium]